MISNKRCTAADIPKLCWNKIFQNGIKGGDIREKAVFEDALFEILDTTREEYTKMLPKAANSSRLR